MLSNSARVAPCSAAHTRIPSALSTSAAVGSFPVTSQIALAHDSDNTPVVIAPAIFGCSLTRRSQALCAIAAAWLMFVWWISQDRVLYSPSAEYPSPAVNAPRIKARATVAIEWPSSRTFRQRACSSARIAVGSAAVRYRSEARNMSSASESLAGGAAAVTVTWAHLRVLGGTSRAGWSLLATGAGGRGRCRATARSG
jgi:hypothetical protein